jgi:serine/threonine protein kinase
LDGLTLYLSFSPSLQGLKTLQDTGLCHRNLSLDAVEMDGDHLDICQLGWVLRFDRNTSVDEDRPLPPPGGLDPNFIAPEYFGTIRGEWNGFSADLWSSGLMLFSMVVGSGALFTAPIMEDKSFHRMCIRSDIQGQVTKYGKLVGKDFSGLSQEVLDLLGNMLKADPKQRLSLEQVIEHPWLTKDELTTPTQWKELQEAKS